MIKTFNQYVEEGPSRLWLEKSKEHFGRVIDPREGGLHKILEGEEIFVYETFTLPQLIHALQTTEMPERGPLQIGERNEVGDNFTIKVFNKIPDFAEFHQAVREKFTGPGYEVTNPEAGEPYYGKPGTSFSVYKANSRQRAFVSHLDEWAENEYMAIWHGRQGSQEAALKFAEMIRDNDYPAHLGILSEDKHWIHGVYHDPDYKSS